MSGFVHLHVHSQYSLLDGAGRIKDLVSSAAKFNMPAIALTDHGNMYGAVEFYKAAKACGIKPIIGCEVYISPGSRFDKKASDNERYYHLVLLAENQVGYRNLIELVSKAYTEGFYYKPRIDKELLAAHREGLIGLSACIAGEVPALILKEDISAAEAAARQYAEIFGPDNFFIELQDHNMPEQMQSNPILIGIAQRLGLPLVATNDLHYIRRSDAESHDVLLCIQTGKHVADSARMKFPSSEFYLKTAEEMTELFSETPEALANTCRIAERCQVAFEFGTLHLPEFPLPEAITADEYLRKLCREGLVKRYPTASPEVLDRLDYELGVIQSMGFPGYFLIVWDFILYAKQQGIPVGPGRGSSAGSIVAYLLEITNIDPLRYGLLFERFLNPERVSMPDIDIDFCYERRSEVIEYVAKTYGADHVAQIITFGSMKAKAAIRDAGRALGVPYAEVDRVAKLVPSVLNITLAEALATNQELKNLCNEDAAAGRILSTAVAIEGAPRNASTHAAGLVITKEPVTCQVPVQTGTEKFLVTQFDKNYIEELGFLKMDLLGLRTLTVISDAVAMIKVSHGVEIDIDAIPLEDRITCKILQRGETAGVFQLESDGMTKLVKDLHPERFEDLIPLVALYRPGPLGSGMVEDFIQGRHGKKVVTYQHPLLEPILRETFGVILYQEQVMQIASTLGGFTLGQADLLRRAMGKKKLEILAAQRERFLTGAAERSVEASIAVDVFDLMEKFADYGFNKSHSAAYALVAYQTAYLKAHHPAEFMAAILSSVMEDTEKMAALILACRQMKLTILPPDINHSQAKFSVAKGAIRFGLSGIKSVGGGAVENILAIRCEAGSYCSLDDFCSRVNLRVSNRRVIESLLKSGAFDFTGIPRSDLLSSLPETLSKAAARRDRNASPGISLFGEEVYLEIELSGPQQDSAPPSSEILAMEKEVTGVYLTGHPLDAYADVLKAVGKISTLLNNPPPPGHSVKLAGIIGSVRKTQTKSGDGMCQLSLEDSTGSVEVVLFPKVYAKYLTRLDCNQAVVISGQAGTKEGGVKIIADSLSILDRRHKVSQIRIQIDTQKCDDLFYQRLQKVLASHHGGSEVVFVFPEYGLKLSIDLQYWIEATAEALQAIEEVVGAGKVIPEDDGSF